MIDEKSDFDCKYAGISRPATSKSRWLPGMNFDVRDGVGENDPS
jgi:hypothetical protein